MRILVVAPQPFYAERGTPIAVRLLVTTLCEAGHDVDLLVFHEGEDIDVRGLALSRTAALPFLRHIPIGFSWKKLVCDLLISIKTARFMASRKYDVVHAVEEAVFPVVLLKRFFRCDVVYDMDSSLSEQLVEKWSWVARIEWLLNGIEKFAIRRADLILAVCPYLAEKVGACVPDKIIQVLEDPPLTPKEPLEANEDLRGALGIEGTLLLYVGNLEQYQGIDLLLEAMQDWSPDSRAHLVIIGGEGGDLERYRDKVRALGLAGNVHLPGARPVAALGHYLAQADILVSPRIRGGNTPMKIYSYLAAGRAILATNTASHTQVLDDACALLVEPRAEAMLSGMRTLVGNSKLRESLGRNARSRAEGDYSEAAYRRKLLGAYSRLSGGRGDPHSAS